MNATDTPFTNPQRTRYYGLRPGDRIRYGPFGTRPPREGTVEELHPMDNNKVGVLWEDGTRSFCVAEWATRVQDSEVKP